MKVKSLLIVYKEKDEAFFNQLKDLIEKKDDDENGTVGTTDGSIRVFKCSEKQWLKHKEKGREDKLADKVLFIDDIKDIIVPDPIYNKYGISYGVIDHRNFAIIVDEKFEWTEDLYKEFQEDLKVITEDEEVTEKDAFAGKEEAKQGMKKKGKFMALGLLFPPALLVAGGMAAKDVSDAIKNANMIRSQMLYYAITKVYMEELEAFMKL